VSTAPDLHQTISRLVRKDRGRLLSALIANLNSFDLAEDALSDALESALIHWRRTGVPENPRGWLLKVAHRKAIDRIRRDVRFSERKPELERLAAEDELHTNESAPEIPDKRLALIFTCCHPALDAKSRVALTLRTLGGLSTAEIARAYLDKEATMGQRLSRAKSKIATSKIPYIVPGPELWEDRLASVLAVIYLIFNEGYAASSGSSSLRVELCEEAIYLARLLNDLRTGEAEILGLLALMLSAHSRRAARQSGDGVTIVLSQQDRSLWDQDMASQAGRLLQFALAIGKPGPYQIKAAISALHDGTQTASATDWPQIVLLYDRLLGFEPTPVVRLNRAVALAESGKIDSALLEIDRIGEFLTAYQPLYAARAEFLGRLGKYDQARKAYDRAISLTGNKSDLAFLKARRASLAGPAVH